MRKVVALVLLLVLTAGVLYWKYYYVEPVPKPKFWGYTDPPALINMSWQRDGAVEVLNLTTENASRLYGELLSQFQRIGYSMSQGNWSSVACQWSLWDSRNRTYYIAYNGSRFLAVRGPYEDVVKFAEGEWLCGKPSSEVMLPTPSPWKVAGVLAVSIGNALMENNVSVSPAAWNGPLPDWYLAKFSLEVNVGSGVSLLILIYSNESEVKYAEYLLRKADRGLRFIESDAGDYKALLVLKGNRKDVERVMNLIEG